MVTSRSGFDELRFPDDLASTITREEYRRNEKAREDRCESERVRVESVGYSGSRLA